MTPADGRLLDVLDRPLIGARIDFDRVGRYFRLHTDTRKFVILEEHVVHSIEASRMFNAACFAVAVHALRSATDEGRK
jgi:hypothetical protein